MIKPQKYSKKEVNLHHSLRFSSFVHHLVQPHHHFTPAPHLKAARAAAVRGGSVLPRAGKWREGGVVHFRMRGVMVGRLVQNVQIAANLLNQYNCCCFRTFPPLSFTLHTCESYGVLPRDSQGCEGEAENGEAVAKGSVRQQFGVVDKCGKK